MVHSWATDVDDPTVQPRWGKIGKQKIEDAGTLYPKRMETVDDEILDLALKFVDKAKADGKPFFLWLNPTRMHVVTHLSEKYESMRTPENGWSIQEAGMAQLDDIVGSVMKYLKDNGLEDNTIVVFTTDNGTENFTWPDGGQTPFAGGKGTALGRRLPGAGHPPLARQGAGGHDSERDLLRSGLVSHLRRCGRQSQHRRGTAERKADRRQDLQSPPRRLQPDGRDHRQGTVRAPRDLLLHRGHARGRADRRLQVSLHRSARRLAGRHGQSRLADPCQSPPRSLRAHRACPVAARARSLTTTGLSTSSGASYSCSRRSAKYAQTFLEYPPMQEGASFNMSALKAEMEKRMEQLQSSPSK